MAPSGAPLAFQLKGLEKLAHSHNWTDAAKTYLEYPNFITAMRDWAAKDPQHLHDMLEKVRRRHRLQPHN